MTNDDLSKELPVLADVLGPARERTESTWMLEFIESRIPWYRLLDRDLSALVLAGVTIRKLAECYRDSLFNRPEIQKVMFEVHGAALLAEVASEIDLHVLRGDGTNRNFDVLAIIEGTAVNADVKTRKDEFPFNLPEIHGEEKGLHGGSRATLDRHDAAALGPANWQANNGPHHNPHPESTVIRQVLGTALAQMPEHGCNVVLFGQIEGNHQNLVDALLGTEYIEFVKDVKTNKSFQRVRRMQTGAFTAPDSAEMFGALSGVLWYRLWRDDNCIRGSYRGHRNPNANVPFPESVRDILDGYSPASVPGGFQRCCCLAPCFPGEPHRGR
jgi:hypothetical protein